MRVVVQILFVYCHRDIYIYTFSVQLHYKTERKEEEEEEEKIRKLLFRYVADGTI
jgi:hypothetical protein